MKFRDFLNEEYRGTVKVGGGTTVELHRNPKLSEFKKLPSDFELKGWIHADTGDLWVFYPMGEWIDAGDFEHEDVFKKTRLPKSSKMIPIYIKRNQVDIGEWSMNIAMNYANGWDKMYDKVLDKLGPQNALWAVQAKAVAIIKKNENLKRFYGGKSYKVGEF